MQEIDEMENDSDIDFEKRRVKRKKKRNNSKY